jgi:hypothetical protein
MGSIRNTCPSPLLFIVNKGNHCMDTYSDILVVSRMGRMHCCTVVPSQGICRTSGPQHSQPQQVTALPWPIYGQEERSPESTAISSCGFNADYGRAVLELLQDCSQVLIVSYHHLPRPKPLPLPNPLPHPNPLPKP